MVVTRTEVTVRAIAASMVPAKGFGWLSGTDVSPDGVADADERWLVSRSGPAALRRSDHWASAAREFQALENGEGADARIEELATRHGWLVRPLSLQTHKVAAGARASFVGGLVGERRSDWIAEARGYAGLRRLYDLLSMAERTSDPDAKRALARVVSSRSDGVRYDLPGEPGPPLHGLVERRSLPKDVRLGDVIGAARLALTVEVNERLRRMVSPQITVGRRGEMRLVAQGLLGALYLGFAIELSATTSTLRELRCQFEFCGLWFQGRTNKRYCSQKHKDAAAYQRRKRARVPRRSRLSDP